LPLLVSDGDKLELLLTSDKGWSDCGLSCYAAVYWGRADVSANVLGVHFTVWCKSEFFLFWLLLPLLLSFAG